jgi:hypothetical protein
MPTRTRACHPTDQVESMENHGDTEFTEPRTKK